MPEKKTPSTSREALDNLFDLLEGTPEDAFTEPIEEVRADLRREGIDTTSLKKFAHEKLAQIRAAARLERARKEKEWMDRLRSQVLAAKAATGPQRRENGLVAVRMLAERQPAHAEVYHRKFENSSDEDLLSLLEDIEVLDAADKADKGRS